MPYSPATELLYANQPAENSAGLTDAQLIDYAVQAGVSKAAVESAITSQKYAPWVGAATDAFTKAGYDGTPTILVNGTSLGTKWSPAELKAAVEAAAK